MSSSKKNRLGDSLSRKSFDNLFHFGESQTEKDACLRTLKKYAPPPDKVPAKPLEIRYTKITLTNFKYNSVPFRCRGHVYSNESKVPVSELSDESVIGNTSSGIISVSPKTKISFDEQLHSEVFSQTEEPLTEVSVDTGERILLSRLKHLFPIRKSYGTILAEIIVHQIFGNVEENKVIDPLPSVNFDSFNDAEKTQPLFQRSFNTLFLEPFRTQHKYCSKAILLFSRDFLVKSMKEKPFT